MKKKTFVLSVLITTFILLLILTQSIHYATTNNGLYKAGQKRIQKSYEKNDVVFLGDSSLGAGIDIDYFSELASNDKIYANLAATRREGFISTYNMIRQIVKNNKNIKTIVMVHSPVIWTEPFSLGGYCTSIGGLNSDKIQSLGLAYKYDCIYYKYGNITALKDIFKQMKNTKESKKINNTIKIDNKIKTYKNRKKNIQKELKLNAHAKYAKISLSSLIEIRMIDEYLKDKKVKVLYIQGSFHRDVYEKYKKIIQRQQQVLKSLQNIKFIEKYLYPKSQDMGDSINHVDFTYKKEATKFYFEALKDEL